MFRVIKDFADAKDGYYIYRAGDVFPRSGKKESVDRIRELMTSANATNSPLIVEEEQVERPRRTAKAR